MEEIQKAQNLIAEIEEHLREAGGLLEKSRTDAAQAQAENAIKQASIDATLDEEVTAFEKEGLEGLSQVDEVSQE